MGEGRGVIGRSDDEMEGPPDRVLVLFRYIQVIGDEGVEGEG